MTELDDLESQHASICRELHEGSEHPEFNRALAYRLRDELWERICELRGDEGDAESRWSNFEPPPLPEAEKIASAIRKARSLTPKQVLAISVRAGIHNPDGSLTEKYR